MQTFSSFRIPSNINNGALPRKQPTALTRVHCRCMELVAAIGWCTRKWLRLHQTIRNLTSGDLGIPLVVIRLGVTGLKKTRVVCLSDLFEGRGEKGQCDLVCVEHLSMIGLMVVMLMCY